MEPVLPLEYVELDFQSIEESGDITNLTAEEYLSFVRYQAQNLPLVTRVNVNLKDYEGKQTKYMPLIDDIPTCNNELLPTLNWENTMLSEFSELRSMLSVLALDERTRERKLVVPLLKDINAWHRFCLANEIDEENNIIIKNNSKRNFDKINNIEVINKNNKYNNKEEEKDKVNDEEYLRFKKELLERQLLDNTTQSNINDDNDIIDGSLEEIAINKAIEIATTCPKWEGVIDALPTTSLLLQFDQVMTQKLLGYQIGMYLLI
jgi:hypothetical protein